MLLTAMVGRPSPEAGLNAAMREEAVQRSAAGQPAIGLLPWSFMVEDICIHFKKIKRLGLSNSAHTLC